MNSSVEKLEHARFADAARENSTHSCNKRRTTVDSAGARASVDPAALFTHTRTYETVTSPRSPLSPTTSIESSSTVRPQYSLATVVCPVLLRSCRRRVCGWLVLFYFRWRWCCVRRRVLSLAKEKRGRFSVVLPR